MPRSPGPTATPAPRWRPILMGCSLLAGSMFALTGPGSPQLIQLAPVVVQLSEHARPDAPWAAGIFGDSLYGESGKLRFRAIGPLSWQALPVAFDHAPPAPGVYPAAENFSFLAMRPFGAKLGAHVGNYRMGYWPAELRRAASHEYENPEGFIEVTQAMSRLRVSENFTLGDFITHDQAGVWPKYLVLREALIDKLELVLLELRANGVRADRIIVTSGFRTPHHNRNGIGGEGGARDSRHQFGDAADIIIDNGAGRMADLNRDGRVDVRDADLVLRAVEVIEARHPHLVGGLGRYHSAGPRGPFVHIDVRGERARWSNDARPAGASRPAPRIASSAPAAGGGRSSCVASGPSSVLCASLRHSANR